MPVIVKNLVALLTLGFGVYAFFQPEPVAKVSHLKMDGAAGRAELRVAFGGFFAGLGLAALLLGADAAYQTLGIAYLVTVGVRVAVLVLEGTEDVLTPTYIAFGVFELVSGLILTIPR